MVGKKYIKRADWHNNTDIINKNTKHILENKNDLDLQDIYDTINNTAGKTIPKYKITNLSINSKLKIKTMVER